MGTISDPPEALDWGAALTTCLRAALGLGLSPADAEDAAQAALMRAWRFRHQCRASRAPEAWLRTITRREALRLLAARRDIPADPTVLDQRLESQGVEEPVGGAAELLNGLSPEQRLILHLRYVEDLKQSDIAERLNLPLGTAKVRLHRARQALRHGWNS